MNIPCLLAIAFPFIFFPVLGMFFTSVVVDDIKYMFKCSNVPPPHVKDNMHVNKGLKTNLNQLTICLSFREHITVAVVEKWKTVWKGRRVQRKRNVLML